MAHTHEAAQATHTSRRTPNPHSDAVQEAKRLEKMQAHSSSHRSSGTARPPAAEGSAG